jgi:iron only hydrogenase large subunit-like protein
MAAPYSATMQLAGTDDHITPSQVCIKPVPVAKRDASKVRIALEDDGRLMETDDSGRRELQPAKITLNDCLACSGCVTTAETILISAQSADEFWATVSSPKKKLRVFSLSPQTRASLAAHFKLPVAELQGKLSTALRSWGIDLVFDTSFSRDLSLLETGAEFLARYRKTPGAGPLPMLVAACPGWVCYAEKTHGDFLLPYLSTAMSPQQVMGVLVKQRLAEQRGLKPDEVYHVAAMPCADKKLEAAREDFAPGGVRLVDTVLTSIELLQMLADRGVDLPSLSASPLDTEFSNLDSAGRLFGAPGGSGGFMEVAYRNAARELFGAALPPGPLEVRTKSNADWREVSLLVEGRQVLSFAQCYGFRNIQNLVRKLKAGTCDYQLVEVMACPGGCVNGGGQLRPSSLEQPRDLLRRVEALYSGEQISRLPEENAAAAKLYADWIGGAPGSGEARRRLHTQFHAREKFVSKLAIKW